MLADTSESPKPTRSKQRRTRARATRTRLWKEAQQASSDRQLQDKMSRDFIDAHSKLSQIQSLVYDLHWYSLGQWQVYGTSQDGMQLFDNWRGQTSQEQDVFVASPFRTSDVFFHADHVDSQGVYGQQEHGDDSETHIKDRKNERLQERMVTSNRRFDNVDVEEFEVLVTNSSTKPPSMPMPIGDFRRLPEEAWTQIFAGFETKPGLNEKCDDDDCTEDSSSYSDATTETDMATERRQAGWNSDVFFNFVRRGVLQRRHGYETGYAGVCEICREELAASWLRPADAVLNCIPCADNDTVQEHRQEPASELSGWPTLNDQELKSFQAWCTEAKTAKQKAVISIINDLLSQAEEAEMANDTRLAKQKMDRARELKETLEAMDGMEYMRTQMWKFKQLGAKPPQTNPTE